MTQKTNIKFGIVNSLDTSLNNAKQNGDIVDGKVYITTDKPAIYIKGATVNDTSLIGCGFIANDNQNGLMSTQSYNKLHNILNTYASDSSLELDDINYDTFIKYVAQTLTETQKQQARENIDASPIIIWEEYK